MEFDPPTCYATGLGRTGTQVPTTRDIILAHVEAIRCGKGKALLPLTDDLALLDSGLDSLGIAVLVTRLEDELGIDPFSDPQLTSPPLTLGEFIGVYERAAQSD